MRHDEVIPILDFGSQYAQLIARRVREKGVYSELVRPDISVEDLKKLNPRGLIFSGGPSSVYEPNAPRCDPRVFDLNIPILGICYGMQLGVSRRVRQLGLGHRPLVEATPRASLTDIALREIIAGKLTYEAAPEKPADGTSV